MVTPHEIEGLFAVDLAFLQDFYGVINFGNQEEYDALVDAQQSSAAARPVRPGPTPAAGAGRRAAAGQSADGWPQADAARPTATAAAAGRGDPARGRSRWPPMLRYPTDALWQEIAYLAYHLHWPSGRPARPRAHGPGADGARGGRR